MDSRKKCAQYAICFIFKAAGMVINPPPVLSGGSDPLSVLYMSLSFLCIEGGVVCLLCALAAPSAVVVTVLPSLVENLRWVLAVPLLLELTVGATPAVATADAIVLGFLIVDTARTWKDAYHAFRGRQGASVPAYATVVASGNSHGTFRVTYEIVERGNQ